MLVGMDGIKWFYAGLLTGDAFVNQRVGWVRLKTDAPNAGFVQMVLNSPLGQAQLLRRMTIAQTVGHITLDDIRAVKIPTIESVELDEISNAIVDAKKGRMAAIKLLEASKRAVEIAIEGNEATALTYLDRVGEAG